MGCGFGKGWESGRSCGSEEGLAMGVWSVWLRVLLGLGVNGGGGLTWPGGGVDLLPCGWVDGCGYCALRLVANVLNG